MSTLLLNPLYTVKIRSIICLCLCLHHHHHDHQNHMMMIITRWISVHPPPPPLGHFEDQKCRGTRFLQPDNQATCQVDRNHDVIRNITIFYQSWSLGWFARSLPGNKVPLIFFSLLFSVFQSTIITNFSPNCTLSAFSWGLYFLR